MPTGRLATNVVGFVGDSTVLASGWLPRWSTTSLGRRVVSNRRVRVSPLQTTSPAGASRTLAAMMHCVRSPTISRQQPSGRRRALPPEPESVAAGGSAVHGWPVQGFTRVVDVVDVLVLEVL